MKNETLEQFKKIKRGIKKILKNCLILSILERNTESILKSP